MKTRTIPNHYRRLTAGPWRALTLLVLCAWSLPAFAQSAPPASTEGGITPPADYVIGAEDQLQIVFWREENLSAEVVVRPDGMISLPLLNDVSAAGLTPEQLRVAVTERANKFVEEPTVTVIVKAINSRKVFVTGQVAKPGPYPLGGPTTIVQMLATVGGVLEYAKRERILILRTENGRQITHRFNWKDVSEGKNLAQNIELKPGDTIMVP